MAGQVVEVTVHGHPIARIVPIRGGMLDQLIVEGRASSAEGELLDLADQLLLPAPPLGDRLPSQSLGELRSEEV